MTHGTVVRLAGTLDGYGVRLNVGPRKFLATRVQRDNVDWWDVQARARKGRARWIDAHPDDARVVRALLPDVTRPVVPA